MITILALILAVLIVGAWHKSKTRPISATSDISKYFDKNFVQNGEDLSEGMCEGVATETGENPMAVTIKENTLDTARLKPYVGEIPRKFEFRPQTFKQFIGQEEAKERAKTILKKIRMGLRSHFLVDGIKGHGKTTYVKLIQKELGGKLIQHIGRQINEDNIIDILNEINSSESKHVIWFVDELDSMPTKAIKILNPIIEEFMLAGKKIKPFVFAGATINKHELIKNNPDTLDRMSFHIKFAKYNAEELMQILVQYHKQLYSDVSIAPEQLIQISQNCKFNPRTSISLLEEFVVEQDIAKVLKNNGIVKDGLTNIDMKILDALSQVKRMGSNALAVKVGMGEKEYLVEYEPFLVEYGYINRVPNRIIAPKGLEILRQLKG